MALVIPRTKDSHVSANPVHIDDGKSVTVSPTQACNEIIRIGIVEGTDVLWVNSRSCADGSFQLFGPGDFYFSKGVTAFPLGVSVI